MLNSLDPNRLADRGPAGLNLLTVVGAAAKIASGDITAEALLRDCLARIEARDRDLKTWAFVDRERALADARARDAETPLGKLHGVPIGIKDIIDTGDMPTEYGSSIYKGFRPDRDQACVTALRQAGAVLPGKTTTTEFASPVPIGVVNPHDAGRSPGVSSSGSAASVADFMVPAALGTQTGGSVIVPAAFCGVWGFKASLDGLDRAGFRHLRPTLDTLGILARDAGDLALVQAAMTGTEPAASPDGPVRIGICRTPNWSEAQPETVAAMETAAGRLAAEGAEIGEVKLSGEFDDVDALHRTISSYESVRSLATEHRDNADALNSWIRDGIASGQAVGDAAYDAARARAAALRAELADIFRSWDALLTPSTNGEATTDLTGISNSAFNRMWTLMHGPCVTIPAYTGPHGAPVGVQLVGPVGADARLIALAGWVGKRIV